MDTVELFCGAGGGVQAHTYLLGHGVAAVAEAAPYPLHVIRYRMAHDQIPKATIYTDVRAVQGRKYRGVGCVSGGFPCQDLSAAGKGIGLDGERSGLVFEMLRVVAEARPAYVFAENSPRLRLKGLGRILVALNAIGYGDIVWGVIGGNSVGAPHIRQRMWLLAKRGRAVESMREPAAPPANGRLRKGVVTAVKPWVTPGAAPTMPTLLSADAAKSGNRPDPTLWSLSDILGITAKAKRLGIGQLPTLAATDWKSPYGLKGLMEQLKKRSKPLRDVLPLIEGGRSINPLWAEWYMGWCPDWTDLSVDKPDIASWLDLTRRGAWWSDDVEASVLPRTLKTGQAVENTGPRIKALGNGQIPLCAAVAFHALHEALG